MKISFWPQTRYGKWLAKLLAALVGFFVFAQILLFFGMQENGAEVSISPAIQ
jgi:hypothetical protein